MADRSVKKEQQQQESESHEASEVQSPSASTQYTGRGAVPPVSLETGTAPPSASERAYGSRPAQLQAHAYAQGTDIHMAPGQEKHLPHEAWHVAQQKQGRVKPTMQVQEDEALEHEAVETGTRAQR